MEEQKTFYVTTAIPYVNAKMHIGNAMDFIYADALARYARQQGYETLFLTGTDEHGAKIEQKANELGIPVQKFVDQNVEQVKEMLTKLNISNDIFIRTTDPEHERIAQLVWNNMKDDIYKGSYIGLYCVGCEAYVTEKQAQANSGKCPDHDRVYDKLEEENYFFALSKYTSRIAESIASDQLKIIPETRKNEIMSLLREGLDDISISRPRSKISWGVPVPGDNTQVMYVWLDALLNYITAIGYPDSDNFTKYWPANVQIIGKDILRFHAAIWPAVLMSLGISLPKKLYVHGHVQSSGQKMSKTLGNVVDPLAIVSDYGIDPFRYYFYRHIPSGNDGDYSPEKFLSAYNNELANELGNLVQRVSKMCMQYLNGVIGDVPPAEHDMGQYHEAMINCRFDTAMEEVWEQVRGLNQYIEEEKPWAVAKLGDETHTREVLAYCASSLLEIAELLEPFLPATAEKINYIFSEGILREADSVLFMRRDTK
jgi:methionyl-tRNA synthetase